MNKLTDVRWLKMWKSNKTYNTKQNELLQNVLLIFNHTLVIVLQVSRKKKKMSKRVIS